MSFFEWQVKKDRVPQMIDYTECLLDTELNGRNVSSIYRLRSKSFRPTILHTIAVVLSPDHHYLVILDKRKHTEEAEKSSSTALLG